MKNYFTRKNKTFSHALPAGLAVLLATAMGTNPALAWGHGGHDGPRGHDGSLGNIDRGHDPASDIYTSPGLKVTTASQVNTLPDGKVALLKGPVAGQINGDQFLFQDGSGLAPVLIKQSDWHSLQAGTSDLVEIHDRIVHTDAGAAVQGERVATIPG